MLRPLGIEVGKGAWVGAFVDWRLGGQLILGSGVKIFDHVVIGGWGGRIVVGARTQINEGTLIVANLGTVVIGVDCQIAHMVSMKTSTHKIQPESTCIGGETEFKDIRIGDGCWIAEGSVILPGAEIGCKNIIAAGAVVQGKIYEEECSLFAGVPAVVKKHYPPPNFGPQK